MGKTERVILIKGDHKKWYNQAIFIINPATTKEQLPTDLVAEAEKIIANYMTKPPPAPNTVISAQQNNKKTKRLDFALNIIMMLICIAIVAVIVYGMRMG
ncbi:MAG: hypothetical protein FWC78_06590 [Defluviitaleaceae bacterium]|nr:hypothetical protein [Defluviitaleaceae bacterium]